MKQVTLFENTLNPRKDIEPQWTFWFKRHSRYTLGEHIFAYFDDLVDDICETYKVKNLEELDNTKELKVVVMGEHSDVVLKARDTANIAEVLTAEWDEGIIGYAVAEKGTQFESLEEELDLYTGYINGYCGTVFFFETEEAYQKGIANNYAFSDMLDNAISGQPFWGSNHLDRIVECTEQGYGNVESNKELYR